MKREEKLDIHIRICAAYFSICFVVFQKGQTVGELPGYYTSCCSVYYVYYLYKEEEEEEEEEEKKA